MEYKFANMFPLYQDMKKNNKPQEKFHFMLKRVRFEVILLIDREPFELLVGVVGQHLAFTLILRKGFVTEIPSAIYYDLCKVLQLNYSEDHFSSFAFLKEIDNAIPGKCSKARVQPHEISRYKKNQDDDEKDYFLGWIHHINDGNHVTTENLDKTRRFLGNDVADFCQKNNISTKWTSNFNESCNYFDPPGYAAST